MSKFNQTGVAPVSVTTTPNTVTNEGAPSFKMDYKLELYQAVVTTLFGEGKFYEGANDRAKRITRLVKRCVENGQAEFVAKLAVYARERMHLRSVPVFLVVTLAKVLREVEADAFNFNAVESVEYKKIRALTTRVIQRADELREMFAAAEAIFGDPKDNKVFKRVASKALLKGMGDAFNKFDSYQFKKYSGGKGSVKFSDVMRVVHPTPENKEKSELFKQVMEGTLPAIDTWETKSAALGQAEYETEEDKAEATKVMWQAHADSSRQPYMAKLRNLRNYAEHKVDLTNVIDHLTNPLAVANSKQLPFRFYTAYRELGGETITSCWHNEYKDSGKTVGSPQLLGALEDAFDLSVNNLPDLGDDVLIVVDQSGSMWSPVSGRSTAMCCEIGGVLGAAVWYNQVVNLGKKAMVAGFACKGKVYNWSKRTSSLSAAKQMMNTNLGISTQINTAWQAAKDAGLKPSTIVVLSDMQLTGDGSYYGHNDIMNPEDYGLADANTLKISVNLQGYDNTPLAMNNGWYQIAGWSDKIFDVIEAMKNPGDAVNVILNDIDI